VVHGQLEALSCLLDVISTMKERRDIIDVRNKQQQTALHLAAMADNVGAVIVRMLSFLTFQRCDWLHAVWTIISLQFPVFCIYAAEILIEKQILSLFSLIFSFPMIWKSFNAFSTFIFAMVKNPRNNFFRQNTAQLECALGSWGVWKSMKKKVDIFPAWKNLGKFFCSVSMEKENNFPDLIFRHAFWQYFVEDW